MPTQPRDTRPAPSGRDPGAGEIGAVLLGLAVVAATAIHRPSAAPSTPADGAIHPTAVAARRDASAGPPEAAGMPSGTQDPVSASPAVGRASTRDEATRGEATRLAAGPTMTAAPGDTSPTRTGPTGAGPTTRSDVTITQSAPTRTATAPPTQTEPITHTLPGAAIPPPRLVDGIADVPPPYLSFDRPFDADADADVRPSRYYPYGTTGRGEYLLHHGVDIGNPLGTPVRAVAAGTVVFAGLDTDELWGPQNDFYGTLVVVAHAERLDEHMLYSLSGHLSDVAVRAGQRVEAGETIGSVGMTGVALGPHLHLEFRTAARDYDATRNPELLLEPLPGQGIIIGRLLTDGRLPAASTDVALFAAAGDQPGTWLGTTTTYPPEHVNSASEWGENFVFGDLPSGQYVVEATVNGERLTALVTVADGAASVVTLEPARG